LPHSKTIPPLFWSNFSLRREMRSEEGLDTALKAICTTPRNVLLVGATSTGRKGTSLSCVLQVMELADANWANCKVQSGSASGEGLIHHLRDPIRKAVDGE
jgi:hypothetical protein